MNKNSKYAKNIRNQLAAQNISYGTLSKRSGIPKSALQRYATGETENIPINRIEAIAQALNVPPAVLFSWSDEDTANSVATLQEVVEIYTHLSPQFQTIALEQLRTLSKAETQKEEAF